MKAELLFCISSHHRCFTPRLLVNSVRSATVSSENNSLFECYSLPEQNLSRTLKALCSEYHFVFFFSFLFIPRRSKPAVGKNTHKSWFSKFLNNFNYLKISVSSFRSVKFVACYKSIFFWILSVTLLSVFCSPLGAISNVSIPLRYTMLSKIIIYNPVLFRLFLCSTPINSYIIEFGLKKPFRLRGLIADRGKM